MTDPRFPLIEQALASLNDVVLICEAEPVDEPGPRIVYVNGAFERMSGYSAADVIGRTTRLLQGPRTARPELDRLRAAIIAWESCRVAVTNYRKDGTPFDVEFDVVPVADETGWYTHWVSMQRDISVRSCAQRQIESADSVESLATGVLRELVEYASADGACWEQRETVADQWETLHAVTRSAATAGAAGAVYVEGTDRVPADLVRTDSPRCVVAALGVPDGASARIVLWSDGRALPEYAAPLAHAIAARSVGTFDRLRADAARLHLAERLRQAQRLESVGRLAGGIAHDFNNLLTVIVGNLELLKDRIPTPSDDRGEIHLEIAEVMRATDRACDLVRHLLAFSRQQPLSLTAVDLRAVIRDTVSLLQRALGTHITLATAIPADLPVVTGDVALIEQVLVNLAVNARDAMESANPDPSMPTTGRITVQVTPVDVHAGGSPEWERLADGAYLCLSVSDNGPGMSPEVLARAFDPFFTTKPVGAGTGLGLSSVYGAVTQMGGWIRLSPASPHGVVARIMLPVHTGAD